MVAFVTIALIALAAAAALATVASIGRPRPAVTPGAAVATIVTQGFVIVGIYFLGTR